MNLTCQLAHDRLLDGNLDANLSEHIRTCEECCAFASGLASMDAELASLPRLDAPDLLVDRTLARIQADMGLHLVQSEPMPEAAPSLPSAEVTPNAVREPGAPLGLGSLLLAAFSMLMAAVGALVFLPVTLLTWLRDLASTRPDAPPPSTPKLPAEPTFAFNRAPLRTLRWAIPVVAISSVGLVVVLSGTLGLTTHYRISEASGTMGTMGSDGDGWASGQMGGYEEEYEPAYEVASAPPAPLIAAPAALPVAAYAVEPANGTDPMSALGALTGDQVSQGGFGGLGLRGTGRGGGGTGEGTIGLGHFGQAGIVPADDAEDEHTVRHARPRITSTPSATPRRIPTRIGNLRAPSDMPSADASEVTDEPIQGRDGRFDDEMPRAARQQFQALGYVGGPDVPEYFSRNPNQQASPRASTWQDAQRTTGLTFAAHDGWWENTYVPGDAAIRMLQARLASAGGQYLSNTELARPTLPTVAAPTERAMAVGVHADRAAIEGPTRVRVEVGLRGIAQAAGRRGALRIALVIDAEDALDADAQSRIRALVGNLARSAGRRDRVVIVAAGAHGGTLVPLGTMRAGAVEVALRHLFGAGHHGAQTSLSDAVSAAVQGVMSDDGASLVLLATPDGVHDTALEEVIRQGALAGVVTSAIGITASASSNLDALALAGQGRRGLVLNDADANRVVRSELTATARLIARALRLRVRLAPGVELIEVLGSHPLNQEESRRTRATETAIDQQLSRRLGIASDRDDDQDGIRILLPSFYAGDSHTVVLDLLVTRPGPIVDVDVQFKDLVRLGNGNVSVALSLPSGTAARGVREQRVLASYIAQRVSIALDAAGDLAAHGRWPEATARIDEARALIVAARTEVPALATSPSVQADEALLAQYRTSVGGGLQPTHVADSLHYASHRRLLLPQLATIE